MCIRDRLNTVEKIQVAKQLEALGVDVIEAGFPISCLLYTSTTMQI